MGPSSTSEPTDPMRHRDLTQLKRQAKELLRAFRQGDAAAVETVARHFDGTDPATFRLAQAQLVLARRLGFRSWTRLKEAVEANVGTQQGRCRSRPRTPPRHMLKEVYRYDVEPLDGRKAWAMFEACGHGDVDAVKELLAQEPNLVHAQNWYQGPLHFAVRGGHYEVTKLLLDHGADAGRSRFMYYGWEDLLSDARARGFDDILKLLEETLAERYAYHPDFGDLIQAVTSRDLAQIKAVCRGRPEIVKATDCYGNTAIHWAVMTRQLDVLNFFLEQGATIDQQRSDGQTPAQLALNGDYHYRVNRELKGLKVPSREEVVRHLLARGARYEFSLAAALGDLSRVQAILKEEPDRAAKLDSSRRSPLTYAAAGGHLEIVRLLLAHGADPNRSEELAPDGHALFSAAANNHLDVAKLLLEHGANPNAGSDSSGSCLTIVRHKHGNAAKPMEELLIAYGAHRPVWSLSAEEMKDALRRGDPIVQDDEFINEALGRNDVELIDLLYEKEPGFIDQVHGGMLRAPNPDVALREPQVLRRLLELGFDPERPDWLGKTALHHYAGAGDAKNLLLLLEQGADVDALDDEFGGTPLAWAAREGHLECVRVLLDHGADPSAPAQHPWAQPLEQAEANGHTEVAALLRSGS